MDIQWVIIADSFSVGTNGQMDVQGILGEIKAKHPAYRTTFLVLIKIHIESKDIGKDVELTLQIKRKGRELVASIPKLYKIGGLGDLTKSTPFVYFDVKGFPFRKIGDYSFDISIDSELKAREWLTISDIGDEK